MEIRLASGAGIPESCILSMRKGGTRRQAALEKLRGEPFKFPSSAKACNEPLQIDVLMKIASARLVLRPDDASYKVGLETHESKAQPMTLGIVVSSEGGPTKESGSAAKKQADAAKAKSAQTYLDEHG